MRDQRPKPKNGGTAGHAETRSRAFGMARSHGSTNDEAPKFLPSLPARRFGFYRGCVLQSLVEDVVSGAEDSLKTKPNRTPPLSKGGQGVSRGSTRIERYDPRCFPLRKGGRRDTNTQAPFLRSRAETPPRGRELRTSRRAEAMSLDIPFLDRKAPLPEARNERGW
jgi:hypothetical protein